jgi:hypothetical protein
LSQPGEVRISSLTLVPLGDDFGAKMKSFEGSANSVAFEITDNRFENNVWAGIDVASIVADENHIYVVLKGYQWPYHGLFRLNMEDAFQVETRWELTLDLLAVIPLSRASANIGLDGNVYLAGGSQVLLVDSQGQTRNILGKRSNRETLPRSERFAQDPTSGYVVVEAGSDLFVYDEELRPVDRFLVGGTWKTNLGGITSDGKIVLLINRPAGNESESFVQIKSLDDLNGPPIRQWGGSGLKHGQFMGMIQVWVDQSTDSIYVADNTRIQVFDTDENLTSIWQIESLEGGSPCNLLGHPNGLTYYQAKANSRHLIGLNRLGITQRTLVVPVDVSNDSCYPLIVDEYGNFYYAVDNTVHVFNEDGDKLTDTTFSEVTEIKDLVFNTEGHLLVLTSGPQAKIMEVVQSSRP